MDALRRANAKAPPEESIAFRAAVLVAVLAAAHAVLAQGIGGPSLRVGATAGIASGFAYSHWARHRPGLALKAVLATGVVVAFAAFLQQVLGAGEIVAVQAPLAELFLWVQLLHSMDVPARRDLLFSLVSSLVLIAVAGVLSRSANLGPDLLVWAGAALVALVLAHRSELEDHPPLEPAPRCRPPGPTLSSGAVVGSAAGAGALVAVVGLLVLLVIPQAGPGRAISFPAALRDRLPVPQAGGLSNPSLGRGDPGRGGGGGDASDRASFGYFGFADRLDTGVRGRPDGTLVMRVKAGRPDFWRGQTFDVWDGRTWRQSDAGVMVSRGGPPIQLRGTVEDQAELIRERGEQLVQTYYLETPGPNIVFGANAADRVYIADRAVFEMSDGTVRTGVELGAGAVYTVVSSRIPVTAEALRAGDGATALGGPGWPAVRSRYLQLPADVPDRVLGLARDVTASALTTYDKVRALEAWMAAHTTYTLDVPPLPEGADAVEQFLFVDKQGFCEQIASALVVMLRGLGIPARLAVGYLPGERNPFTGLYEVRARDAHAWAEVLFPGLGWQPFDPTAEVPLSGAAVSGRAGQGLLRWLEARRPARSVLVAAGLGGGAVVASAIGVGWAGAAIRRGRARRRRPWSAAALDRMEGLGRHAGRARRPSEGPARYGRALQHSRLADDRLPAVGATVEAELYGGPVSEADRLAADAILADLEVRVGGRRPQKSRADSSGTH